MRSLIVLFSLLLAVSAVDAQVVRLQLNGVVINGGVVMAGGKPAVKQDGTQPMVDTNADLKKQIRTVKDRLAKGDYDTGLRILQRLVLDRPRDIARGPQTNRGAFEPSEDYFVDQSMSLSRKAEALRLIAALPAKGRQAYQDLFGATAQGILRSAVQAGDVAAIADVARRFFHTQAGYEATYRMGTIAFDRSQPFAAASSFERLRSLPDVARRWEPMLSLKTAVCWGRAGFPDKSRQVLLQLKRANGSGRITLGGRTYALFDVRTDPVVWLVRVLGEQPAFAGLAAENWTMVRGGASRNVSADESVPVWDAAWTVPTIRRMGADDPARSDDPERLKAAENDLIAMVRSKRQGGFLTLPVAQPLIVNDIVLFHTLDNLRAVHLKTGEVVWETSIHDPQFDELARTGTNVLNASQTARTQLQQFLAQRMFHNQTWGTLSSDGTSVYSIEDLGVLSRSVRRIPGMLFPGSTDISNKLASFEIATGKPRWIIGGPRSDNAVDLAGTFFLGPPLPLDGILYCLTENSGEVRLLALDAMTGRQRWSQTLLLPVNSLEQDPTRTMGGLSPSYANGVLICPTSAGALIAFDLSRRMLLWGFRYHSTTAAVSQNPQLAMLRRQRRMTGNYGLDTENRWLDSLPLIVDGHVLLTPKDSNELFCLDQLDGRLLWKQPRGEGLYLAGVHDGKVIVVERSQVRARNLADGKPAWKQPLPIPLPSGRGVRTGRLFHLPLTTAEIATIDLQTGRILARAPSRTGDVAGNLVSSDGTLVTQAFGRLVGFKPLEVLRAEIRDRLKGNPNDAGALALRGGIRLHRGFEATGLDDLRHAVRLKPDSPARDVLVATLLEGLRFDFVSYRGTAAEIEKLVGNARQKSRYLRLYAAGLQQVGEQQAAFAEYLKLIGSDGNENELEPISGSLSVRTDRWLRTRFAELYRSADPAARQRMLVAVRGRLNDALNNKTPTRLRGFLESFAELPIAEPARKALVERLDDKRSASELALRLERLRHAEDRETAAYAAARLARLLIDKQKLDDRLEMLLDELNTKWADVACLDKKTGRQLAESWRALPNVADALVLKTDWPPGPVKVTHPYHRASYRRFYPVPFSADPGSVFRGWLLRIDQRGQVLVAIDSNGVERWRLSLRSAQRTVRSSYLGSMGNYALAQGHLLVVGLGSRFLVLDTLAATLKNEPKIVWQKFLYKHRPELTGGRGKQVQARWVMLPNGQRQMKLLDPSFQPMGTVGPVTSEMVCYQVGTTVYAADPLTGSTLWERRNLPRGGTLFGDDQYVFLLQPNSEQVIVLRADDGVRLGERTLPGISKRLAIRGRTVLTSTTIGTKRRLSLLDALTSRPIWQKEFTSKAQIVLVGHDELAVLEPDGRFLIAGINGGTTRLRATVEADKSLDRIVVRRSRDRYVLLTHHLAQKKQRNIRILPPALNSPLINGFAYGFSRRTGRQIWKTRIDQQSLDPAQSPELPILVFTVRRYQLRPKAGRVHRNPYSIAVLDVRTGRFLYRREGTMSLAGFSLLVDRPHHTIDVKLYRSTIRLAFTDRLATPVKAKKP